MIIEEPVTEIIGRQPAWIIKSGVTLIALVFFALITLSFFIRYPDTVYSEITLTSRTPPLKMVSPSNSIIDELFVVDGQKVQKNTPLVLFDNAADFYILSELENKALNLNNKHSNQPLQLWLKNNMPAFGELQTDVLNLLFVIHEQSDFLTSNHLSLEIQQLKNVKKQYKKLTEQLEVQKAILQEDIQLEHALLNKNKQLSMKGLLSESDLIPTQRLIVSKKLLLQNANIQITSRVIEDNKLDQEIQRLELMLQRKENELKMSLDNAIAKLSLAISEWKKSYLLISPVDGVVSLPNVLRQDQYMELGEDVLTLVHSTDSNVATLNVPQDGVGKVKKGQKVEIEMSSFPAAEFGKFQGIVSSISLVPGERGYLVKVSLPEKLISSFGYNLNITPNMIGKAKIITNERRLIHRFFDGLVYAINR